MIETIIKENLNNPGQLEKLYQEDKKLFRSGFLNVYPEIRDNQLAGFWNVRLGYDSPAEGSLKVTKTDILFLIVTCLITGFLIKLPHLFNIGLNDYFFYAKNGGLIVLLGLSGYTILTKEFIGKKHLMRVISAFLLSAIYINLLPSDKNSNSINLVYMHLPFLLWCIYGLVYIGFDLKNRTKYMAYIRYNGDLAILFALIAVSGMILTAVTVGLFSAIDIKIERFYFDWVVVVGAVSAPVVAAFIIRNYPSVTSRIAPVIANIFSPLVLITLIIYLITIILARKDPYNDRDFLLVFNLMLLGVMGIIVFAISENSIFRRKKFIEITLFALAIVTLIIDLVALSAILFRIGEFGFTPNRTAVLGSNLLIFGNLILITIDLFKANFKGSEISRLEFTIAGYLPVYAIWAIFVVFGFPLIFGLK
jgi:hypothetical protein